MKEITKKDLQLLSAYLDGEVSDKESNYIEEKLRTSLIFKQKFDELKKIKELTSSVKKISESPFFETKILAKIEERNKSAGIKKWIPAIGLVTVTLIIMALLKFNPGFIKNIWEEQKTNIASLYKENLQPLLFTADLTNEDIFNFAFNKELPLDKSRKQYLQLGYDETGKEYIEIKPAGAIESKATYSNFIKAMKLDENQKQMVDSVVENYAALLGSQVLINEQNTLAINPKLWNYRKAIFADLIVLAEDLNKDEFYKIMPAGFSPVEKVRVVTAVNKLNQVPDNQYIFLTPDSIFEDTYVFDSEKFEKELEEIKKHLAEVDENLKKIQVEIKYDSVWKKFDDESVTWKGNFNINIDSNICRIGIGPMQIEEYYISDFDSMSYWLDEADKNIKHYSFRIPNIEHSYRGFKMEYYDGDSMKTYEYKFENFDIDSLYGLRDFKEFEQWDKYKEFNDSIMEQLRDQLEFEMNNDSVFFFDSESFKEQMRMMREQLREMQKEMMENQSAPEEMNTNRLK